MSQEVERDLGKGSRIKAFGLLSGLTVIERRIAILAFLCAIVARFYGLLPGYSNDDYVHFFGDTPLSTASVNYRDRRLLSQLVFSSLFKLGAEPPFSIALGWVLLTACLIAVGILICRLWHVDRYPIAAAAAVLIFVLHPYQTEIFTFKEVTLVTALALALAFFGLALCGPQKRSWLLSGGLIAASLSIYQLTFNYLLIVILISILINIGEKDIAQPQHLARLKAQFGVLLGAVLLYFVANWVVFTIADVHTVQRTGILSPQHFYERAQQILALFERFFFKTEPIMPATTKWLLISIVAIYIMTALFRYRRALNFQIVIFAFSVFMLTVLACGGLGLVIADWWPAPRLFGHISVFWAGLIALSLSHSNPFTRRVLLCIVTVVIVSFIGTDNHVLVDQWRVNRRDEAEANRILMRIEELPNFGTLKGLVVNGVTWQAPSNTSEFDMNRSAFGAPWSKYAIFKELSGYDFPQAPDAVVDAAKTYCNAGPAWPSARSVTTIQSYAIVCIGQYTHP